jgi:integrase/recombinase XerD
LRTIFSQEVIVPGQARILTAKEIARVQKFLPSARDKVLFALGIYAGLRVGEIVQLRYEQLYTESGGMRSILKIKRSKQKNTVFSDIPTHSKLKETLAKYKHELDGSKWLFPSKESKTGHLTRAQAHNILKNVFEALDLDDASTHSMRRTCLTNMSRAGVPLRTIQEISGHSSLSALQAYLAVDPDDKRRAIDLLRY